MLRYIAVLFLMFASVANADRMVVVELFTSQGCSSCPPADKLLHQLGGREDVLPLAFHVDYWDYIGWKDQFADPKHTTRQRHYARAAGQRTIYTPQMVVQGRDHLVGTKAMALVDLIAKHKRIKAQVEANVSVNAGKATVSINATRNVGPVDIFLVHYQPHQKVNIKRGENAGRMLEYSHIVRDYKKIGSWNGVGEARLEFQADTDLPSAVLIQAADYGPVLAALRLR